MATRRRRSSRRGAAPRRPRCDRHHRRPGRCRRRRRQHPCRGPAPPGRLRGGRPPLHPAMPDHRRRPPRRHRRRHRPRHDVAARRRTDRWVPVRTVPELPDAAGYRRLLARSLHRLDHVELVDPDVLRNADRAALDDAVSDRTCRGSSGTASGSSSVVERARLVIHLGMTGSLVLGRRWRRHRLATIGWCSMATPRSACGTADGSVGSGSPSTPRTWPTSLGGWGLTQPRSPSRSSRPPLGRRRTALKSALMDQSTIAGLGNTLSDEVLWRARLHPETPADSLSPRQLGTLHAAIRDHVQTGLACRGDPTDAVVAHEPAQLADAHLSALRQWPRAQPRDGSNCPVVPLVPGQRIGGPGPRTTRPLIVGDLS